MDIDHIIGFALIALAIILFLALRIDAASQRKAEKAERLQRANDLITMNRTFDMLEKL